MRIQLHPSGRLGNIVQTRSLIRKDVEKNYNRPDVRATSSGCSPYYGNYVQQKCNHWNFMATPFGCGPDMEIRGAHYGKPVV
jgi:hypothetical protein